MTSDSAPRSRAIACVYCGGQHTSADEVKACWLRNQGQELVPAEEAIPFDPGPDDEQFDEVVHSPADRIDGSVAARRGPPSLGRNVIITPGQPIPADWAAAERVVVDPADPTVLPRLVALAAARTGCVLELAPTTSLGEPFATTLPPHAVGPRVRFTSEQLRHHVFSNSVDARDAGTWPLLQQALAAGARPAHDGGGDVQLPDGTSVWLDGGPARFTTPIDGVPVLHRIAVEHGRLTPPRGNSTEAELAPDQRAAVTHEGGAARIIAPAGSGKTRVLTERARHLVQQWRMPASAITLIAFNKRAQEEIAARTTDLPGLQVRTLNAIALAIINGTAPFARQPQRFTTIDEPEVRRLIGRMVKFPRVRNSDPVATWIEALSSARLGLVDPQKVESRYEGDVEGFAEVFLRYRTELARANSVDYDEQVYRAIELLLRDPQARAAAQRSCRLLLVDEFQDLTPAHLLLVRLLAGPDAAVFGVGDDDQTIYGYNGADPAWLIDFADLFPGAGDHPLEVNYRCPAGVVRAADTLLRHNRRRVAKTIRAHHTEADGFVVVAPDTDSVDATVQAVSSAFASGTPAADIAVLTRVNSLLVPVQVALRATGVPTSGGVGLEFLDRTAVRAALAWLRLARSSGDVSPTDVAEALRRPSRSMPPKVAEWVGEQTTLRGLRSLAQRVSNDKVAEFVDDIERLQRMVATRGTTAQLLAALRDSMGLASSIAKLDVHRKGMNRAAQNDDLTALAQLAALQPDPAAFEGWLRTALSSKWSAGGVTLATVHRVKGQEWPLVVVHHADAEQFPHRLAEDDEEERRLFHVAITRASREAVVVASDRPSPFILQCSTEPSAPIRSAAPPTPSRSATPGTKSSVMTKPGDGLSGDDAALFDALRAWRKHAAGGKPAYTVLADAALHDIARTRPASLDQLARVKGVGPAKLQLYGAGILGVVAQH